jgi:hypothetical protein
MSAGVDIRGDVLSVLKDVQTKLDARAIAPAIAVAVVLLFQQHFLTLPTNRNSWPSTGFWGRAARSTNYSLLSDGVDINVNQQGVRQRLEGGPINAKPGQWLTIPARSEAYGRRAREFNNLVFVLFRADLAALVESESQDVSFGRPRKDGTRKVTPGEERGGGVMYWLKKSVNQNANPGVLPGEQRVREVCRLTVEGIASRLIQRGGAA